MNQQKQFDCLGKLTWLWANSPLQQAWPFELAKRFLIPAIAKEQFHLIERDGMPVAYCSWAWLSAEAEMRYLMDPSQLALEDWQSGNRLWFIDWVAPFSSADSWELKRVIAEHFPESVARAIRVKRNSNTARVMRFKGNGLDHTLAQKKLHTYYTEFKQQIERREQISLDHSNHSRG